FSDGEQKKKKLSPAGHFALGVLESEKALNALLTNDVPGAVELANHGVQIVEAAIKAGGEGSYYLPRLLTRRSIVELAAGDLSNAEADATRAIALLKTDLEPGGSPSHPLYA